MKGKGMQKRLHREHTRGNFHVVCTVEKAKRAHRTAKKTDNQKQKIDFHQINMKIVEWSF